MKKLLFVILGIFAFLPLMASVVYTDNEWHVNKLCFASDNNKLIPYPSAFRVRLTPNAMEVDFKIEGEHWKDFQKNKFVVKNAVWPGEESVELFFDPGRSCSRYFQFAVGVDGNRFDKRFEKNPKAWNVSWKVSRQDFEGGVIFKFVIPFDKAFPKPAEGGAAYWNQAIIFCGKSAQEFEAACGSGKGNPRCRSLFLFCKTNRSTEEKLR